MMKMTKRRIRRLLTVPCLLLALCLTLSVTALAVNEVDDQGEVPKADLGVKPVVTIQGNVVVDNGKPTGYYELALCVRSARTIALTADGSAVSEAEYANDVALNPDHATDGTYTFTYYPFSAAAATVGVNADALTAVNWDVTEVAYAAWDGVTGTYAANDTGYPRGIDLVANTDPEVWWGTDPDPFPDVTQAKQNGVYSKAVALDAEGDRSMFTATGQVDDYYENIATGTKTALVTLSAHAPDNKPVVFTTDTPVAVVRFSYDLKRFTKTVVSENQDVNFDITGEDGVDGGFWLGFDRGSDAQVGTGSKTPLTWLADTAEGGSFSFSDQKAAGTEMGQVVWTKIGVATVDESGNATGGWDETEYYYYLGAENYYKYPDAETIQVNINGAPTAVDDVAIPMTVGAKVLTEGTAQNPGATPAEYTYFRNLLRLVDRTLRLKMVNEPTFKKPTGISGPQILFYDWDDTLIGSMVVGKGDVRAQVNAYVEKNMVHPDLRTGDILQNDLAGTLPDLTTVTAATSDADGAAERYKAITDSLDREWTYRGKYSSKVDGSGVIRDEAGEVPGDPNSVPGKEFPLTNKLDYAFYRHFDTVTTLEYQSGGKTTTDRYITSEAVSSNADAALYPWVYGWAIVEDNSARNQSQWTVRRDAAQVENVWTTFGMGELRGLDPSYDMAGNPGAQALPTTLPGTAVPGTSVGDGTGMETKYPAFIDPADVAAPPTDYAYKVSTAGDNGYLRFADFSDVNALLTRPGQNVIIVKAVYEPGPELLVGGQYRMVSEPYYNKLNAPAAANGGAYSVEITLERSSTQRSDGFVRGVNRVRQPAIRQDTTVDQKWIEDVELGIKNDLDNPSINVAKNLTETSYTKVDIDNGEAITFTLALTARQNKVDYFTMETYGLNFVSGGQRSASNYDRYALAHTIDNYYYMSQDGSQNDAFFDKQNFYYQAVRYDVREGTHGFVLYGTLNYLMQQATLVNRGELSNNDFTTSAANAVLNDINLRLMKNGAPAAPSTFMDQTSIATALKNAAADCENYHYGDPDFWNNELDCAELTYHQLQHYIMGKGLMTRAAADADKFTWCHLHKDCFVDENAAQIPTNWEELIAAARSEDPEVQDAIGMLTSGAIGTIEEITGLRTKNTGDYFASASDFKNQIIRAVSVLDGAGVPVSWPTVQYYMLTGTAPASEQTAIDTMKASYWWYDGAAARTTPNSLSTLSDASQDYFNDVTLKDGVTHHGGFTAKMAPAKSVFDINAGVGENEASAGWIAMTRNLVKAYENFDNVYDDDGNVVGTDYGELDGTGNTTKFISYTEFSSYWLGFQGLAREIGLTAGHEQYWELIQYYVLQTTAGNTMDAAELQRLVDVLADPSDADHAGLIEEFNNYWWKDGKKRLVVNSIPTLLRAARQANEGGDTTPLDRVTMERLESLYLRGSKTGQSFDALGLSRDDVIEKVKVAAALTKVDGDPTSGYLVTNWNDLQYYLIHGDIINDAYLEANFYWWKNGGTGKEVNISGAGSIAARVGLLMEAVIRGSTYGDPKALSTFTDPTKIYSDLALLQTYPGSEFALDGDGMPATSVTADIRQRLEYNSVSDLIAAVTTLMDNARAAQGITVDYTAPSLNWWQMQYGLLHSGTYIPVITSAGSDYYNAYKQYWWYTAGEYIIKPPEAKPEPTQSLLEPLANYVAGSLTAAKLKTEITTAKLNDTYKIRMNEAGDPWSGTKPQAAAKVAIGEMADLLKTTESQYVVDGKVTLTWAQIQCYFIDSYKGRNDNKTNGVTSIMTPEAALSRLVGLGWTKEDGRIPDEVDLSGVSGASLLALDAEELAPEAVEAVVPEETAAPETAEDIQAQIEALERELEALKERLAALEEAAAEAERTEEMPEETSAPVKPASTPAKPATPAETEPTPAETEPVSQEPTPAPSSGERAETPLGGEAARRGVSLPATEEAPPSPALALLEYKRYLNLLVRA